MKQKHCFSSVMTIGQKLSVDIDSKIKSGLPDEMWCIMWLVDTAEQIAPEASGVTAV